MRMALGSGAVVVLAAIALASCGQTNSQAVATAAEPTGELVTAVGCAAPGPAAGCMTITSKGKVYDISTASPAVDPSRGVTVSLRGRSKGETTPCGAKLDDIKYDYLSFQCAAPAAATAEAKTPPPPA